MMKSFLSFLTAIVFLTACNQSSHQQSAVAKSDTAMIDGHPAWIMQGNIYEVNIRQYTAAGTFKAFEPNLDRLKAMGVQTLWFMPINPISKTDRKGSLGSYYAVSTYMDVNPEFGTMAGWKQLVALCHEKGFKVLLDWVPNHTGADHYWLTKHPDFYVKDSTGKPAMAADWADTRKLNYANNELRDTMIAQMKYWIDSTGIDGYRCDVASDVPDDFWKKCIATLRKDKNIFMLAEGDKPALNEDGFDATYTWNDFNIMKEIAKGKKPAYAIDSALHRTDSLFPKNALRMYFTSNHDENSWNGADFSTMPGASHAPFAVFTQTIVRSVPLIYSGQEEPVLRVIRFFDKDTMIFNKYERAPFYAKLLHLRSENEALAANATFMQIHTNADDKVFAYLRTMNNKKVLVVLNWSSKPITVTLNHPQIIGNTTELFTNEKVSVTKGMSLPLNAWGYKVFVY
ncbi:alpha-amylase family glycosyl hydrolase [Hydrotalea sp. AMD]|uniref:alpha-amylase family glycosyl hydrolase n=1 Tax=Hydrotalea sp. AMD TaxID=2501297 RepID=UPI000AB9EC74|nr:alpha-amylase family glycosyl hydrolase [Hydrotalea sp. AMD]